MDTDAAPADRNPLSTVLEALQDEEYQVEEPLPGVLHVTGRFSNPERIALRAAAVSGDGPVALWATSHRGDWVLVCWTRPELVTIVQRGEAPQRWRHRRLPETLNPDAQTFLEGASSPFDLVTRPKHQPTDAARAVLEGFGIDAPHPPGWVPPAVTVPTPVESVVPAAAKPKRAAAPRKPKVEAKPEPVTAICPSCFMALPATGVCDNCA